MSRENIELVRESWEAFRRGDVEWLRLHSHPEVVLVQPAEVPDSKSYVGHEGIVEAVEDWPAQWEDFDLVVVDVIDVSRDQVVAVTRQSGRGRESGIEMTFEIAYLHTIRDGKATRLDMFMTAAQALEAAGLSE
jgi:ketosteroid isomerase-like protein